MPRGRPRVTESWRSLAAQLRERGLSRLPDDTRASMAARLVSLNQAPATAPLRVQPAIVGSAAVLDRLDTLVRRFGGRRLDRETALLPASKMTAFRRAVRRTTPDIALPVAAEAEFSVTVDLAGHWAAAQLVRNLAEAFGWPAGMVTPELTRLPPPASAADRRRADRLLRAWLESLEAALDPQANAEPADMPRPVPVASEVTRALVEQALNSGLCLRLQYLGNIRQVRTRRTIEPRALECAGQRWYLRAYCQWRRAERLFRLDRIVAIEILDESFIGAADSTSIRMSNGVGL